MKRFINPVPQFLKSNGDLCSAGKLYFLQEGTDILTSTKAIYLDAEGASQSINPVTLSNEGRMANVFGEGKYRAKLYDSANVLQWTRDIDFDAESAQFEEWNSQVTYSEKAITQGSDEDYYISEVDNNKGNDPTVGASAQYWSKIALIEFFNADKPGGYADNAVVIDAGRLYASNTANNTNTPPHATWDDLSFNNTVIGNLTVTGNAAITGNLTSASFRSAKRTAAKSISSSTTFEKDTSLEIQNLLVGHYRVTGTITWNPNSAASTNGIQLRVSCTGGSTFFSCAYFGNVNTSSTAIAPLSVSDAISSINGIAIDAVLSAQYQNITFVAMIEITSATHDIWIDWAQKTSNALATTVESGYIVAERI